MMKQKGGLTSIDYEMEDLVALGLVNGGSQTASLKYQAGLGTQS